jgi:opacity protein-like surface antigen
MRTLALDRVSRVSGVSGVSRVPRILRVPRIFRVSRIRTLVAAALAATGLDASDVLANDTQGVVLGLSLHSNHIGAEERTSDAPSGSVFIDKSGGGATLFGGYGFTPSFALLISFDGAVHETTDPDVELTHASFVIEGRYLFREGQSLRPYLAGGIGGFQVASRQGAFDFETTGPGVTFGGGLEIFLARHVALELGVRADFINWEEQRATLTSSDGSQAVVETPIEKEGGAAKIRLGVSFWI